MARKLELVYLLKFLAALGYFSVSLTLALFLTFDLGFTDREAGSLYGLLGMLISLYSVPVGLVIDRVGIRRSLLVGAGLVTASRCALATLEDRRLCVVTLCTGLPLGEAFAVPALSAAVGRLGGEGATSKSGRAERVHRAFGVFYTVMNLGLVAVGPLIDALRARAEEPYRDALRLSAACGAVSLVLAAGLDVSDASDDDSEADESESESESDRLGVDATPEATTDAAAKKNGRSFALLVVLLCGVRSLFRHLDATFPKYFLRRHGPRAPFGAIYSLEPLLIIVLVPLLTNSRAPRRCPRCAVKLFRAVATLEPLDAIVLGAYVGTAAPFCLVLFQAIPASVAFVVSIAVGEAIWAPRFYSLTRGGRVSCPREPSPFWPEQGPRTFDRRHEMAPPARAGAYFALGQVPLFLPKFVAGILSGELLARFCPDDGTRCEAGRQLWLVIGLMSLPFPFAIHYCVTRGHIAQARAPAAVAAEAPTSRARDDDPDPRDARARARSRTQSERDLTAPHVV